MTTIFAAKLRPEELEQGLLNQAMAFFNAGSRCMADIALTPTVTNSPVAPAIVCYAFAAELYLKLLHVIVVGNPEKIHGLADIFTALPETIRRKVGDRYDMGRDNIETDIRAVSSAFVNWRYLHEQTSISINPIILISIAKAVHLVCRELRPTLSVFGENAVVTGHLAL
jgi:hypothetical protein